MIIMKKNIKAQTEWGFVVKLVLGLIILLALIFVAINAKNGFSSMFATLRNIFG